MNAYAPITVAQRPSRFVSNGNQITTAQDILGRHHRNPDLPFIQSTDHKHGATIRALNKEGKIPSCFIAREDDNVIIAEADSVWTATMWLREQGQEFNLAHKII
jgi:hypothetical protein